MTHAVCYFFDVPSRLAHIDSKGRPAFNKDVAPLFKLFWL